MATQTTTLHEISALRSDKYPFGPWRFAGVRIYTLFLGADISISATTLAQIIGGVSPSIASITTIQSLLIFPSKTVRVGLHGVNAQTSGFTLNADSLFTIDNCSMTSLNIYNTVAAAATVFLALGGT